MNILYINYIDFDNVSSGSSVRPAKIYRAMLSLGHNVTMISGMSSWKNAKERKKYLREKWKEIEDMPFDYCYIEWKTTPVFMGNNRFEHTFIKKIKGRGIPIGLFYRDVYWKFSKLFDLHGLRQFIMKQFQKADMRFIKKNVDCVFLPSAKMNEYCGFKKTVSTPPACDIINCAEKTKPNNTVIYVGGLSYAYGSDMLIEAMRIVNGVRKTKLILVCRESEYDWLKQYTVDSDLSWLEVVHASVDELAQYYERADFAICSHRKNDYHDFCMPVKLFEYFSYNKPVIVTNCTEIDNIVEGNELGICGEDNARSIADCIIKGYSDGFDYSRISENVRRYRDGNLWTDRVKLIGDTLR